MSFLAAIPALLSSIGGQGGGKGSETRQVVKINQEQTANQYLNSPSGGSPSGGLPSWAFPVGIAIVAVVLLRK